MVTYDGQGGFSAVGVSHGQMTGVREGLPVTGTYFVNADCTGGQTTNIPGVPPLEDRFVIVDNGREVRTVVVAPLTTIATANLRKRVNGSWPRRCARSTRTFSAWNSTLEN